MSNESSEQSLIKTMLSAEEKLLDVLPEFSLDELIDTFIGTESDILDNHTNLKIILGENGEAGKVAIFSTFRVMKAILAEIEYRIIENII